YVYLYVCVEFGATVVQEVKKSFSNQKVASSIPCRSVLEQGTEPLIAPDVPVCHQCKCKMCIHCKSHICKSLWIKASVKCNVLEMDHGFSEFHGLKCSFMTCGVSAS